MSMRLLRAVSVLKDEHIYQHQSRVTLYAGLLCLAQAGMPLIDIVVPAASYHDIGKIGTVYEVLDKPGPLSEQEWMLMRQHPVLGAEYIERANGSMSLDGNLSAVVLAVRHHHERWDGAGYPDGLRGEDIPLAARIIAVADAFDAMTTGRPYRKAMTREDALREIVRCAGTQFDPAIAEVFLKIFRDDTVQRRAAGC